MSWSPVSSRAINYDPNSKSDPMLSVIQEQDMNYSEKIHFLHVSSIDRNTSTHPSVNNYSIVFEDTFKNVKAIRMIGATIPNQNDVLDNSEVIISIDEINHINFSSNSIVKAFSILPLKGPSRTTDGFITPEMACNLNSELILTTPIAKLNSFTISLKDIQGNSIDFAEPAGSLAKKFQNTFLFKITTLERNRKSLNHRNVY